MKKLLFLCPICWLTIINLQAQQDSTFITTTPIGGFAVITDFYQKNLQLTKAEEKLLDKEVLYFEYFIAEDGKAIFHSLSGIQSKKLTAKIEAASVDLPHFAPATSNGQPIESLYSFILKYEGMQYVQSTPYQEFQPFRLPQPDNNNEIVPADKLIEVYVGIPMNKFVGKVGGKTGLGGGMTVGMLFGRSKLRFGFDMSMYINGIKNDFDLDSALPPNEDLPTIFMGVATATDLVKTSRGVLNLQGNLSYVQMNITKKVDNEWDKFRGFSPNVRLNYVHRIGKTRASWQYGTPSLSAHALQLHVGLAPVFMSDRQGNGWNLDIGIGYRIIAQQIAGIRRKKPKETFRL
ncbi:MAG: hypothetical protein AAGJ18_04170 [Bacteroidota bacterium]